ncbi:6613_t:CDS:2 [Entrophospora sp. SA101]|nr:24484_t:CDS:2 [Entrophospora sp. SA101]CAJ0757075.1 6613_t:CDS:2 [Entrophospora sp. SA101]
MESKRSNARHQTQNFSEVTENYHHNKVKTKIDFLSARHKYISSLETTTDKINTYRSLCSLLHEPDKSGFDSSLADFESAAKYYEMGGKELKAAREFKDAIDFFDKAIELGKEQDYENNHLSDLYYHKAISQKNAGEREEALSSIEEAIKCGGDYIKLNSAKKEISGENKQTSKLLDNANTFGKISTKVKQNNSYPDHSENVVGKNSEGQIGESIPIETTNPTNIETESPCLGAVNSHKPPGLPINNSKAESELNSEEEKQATVDNYPSMSEIEVNMELYGYYDGFMHTFTRAYNFAQTVLHDGVKLNKSEIFIFADVGLCLILFIPIVGKILSQIANIGLNAINKNRIIKASENMCRLAPSIGELESMVKDVIIEVIKNRGETILNYKEDTHNISRIKFLNHHSRKYYHKRYSTATQKLGNSEASELLSKWIFNGNFYEGKKLTLPKEKKDRLIELAIGLTPIITNNDDKLIRSKLPQKDLERLRRLAIEGKWERMLFQRGVKDFLSDSEIKKMLGENTTDEEVENARIILFEEINRSISDSRYKNLKCFIKFSESYPDLVLKIARNSPQRFVSDYIARVYIVTKTENQKSISKL